MALETEIVSTRFDKKTRTGYYTIERDGRRWTVAVPVADLDKHKRNKQLRRNHVANALSRAMLGPPDPPAGTKADPHKPATWQDFDKLNAGVWYLNPSDGELQQKP